MLDRLSILLTLGLGAALFFGLSRTAAALLLGLWTLLTPLVLMALLENERRGLVRRAGGRGAKNEMRLLIRALLYALLLASAALAVARLVIEAN